MHKHILVLVMTSICLLFNLCRAMDTGPSAYQFKVSWDDARNLNKSTTFTFTTTSKSNNPRGALENAAGNKESFPSFEATIKPLIKSGTTIIDHYELQIVPYGHTSSNPPTRSIKENDIVPIRKHIEDIKRQINPTNPNKITDTIGPKNLTTASTAPAWLTLYDTLARLINKYFKERVEIYLLRPPKLIKSKNPAKDVSEEEQKPAPPEQRSFFRPQKALEKAVPLIEESVPLILQQPLTVAETERTAPLAQPKLIETPPELISVASEVSTLLPLPRTLPSQLPSVPPTKINPEPITIETEEGAPITLEEPLQPLTITEAEEITPIPRPQPAPIEPELGPPVKTIDSAMFTYINLVRAGPIGTVSEETGMSFSIESDQKKAIGQAGALFPPSYIKTCTINLNKFASKAYNLILNIEYQEDTQRPIAVNADIPETDWLTIKDTYYQIQTSGNIVKRPIRKDETALINLYNILAETVNKAFKERNIIIFKLDPAAVERSPIPEKLQEYQRIARQKSEGLSYGSLLKSTGAGAAVGAVSMITPLLVGEYLKQEVRSNPDYLQHQEHQNKYEQQFGEYNWNALKATAVLATVGATTGLAYKYSTHHIFGTPAGWNEEFKLLNESNISHKIVSILGKTYLLAKKFDAIEAAGYSADDNAIADIQHYEVYLMPDNAFLFKLFLKICRELPLPRNSLVADNVAFIALRSTPRIYDTYKFTNLLSRKVLPRIVIALKSSLSIDERKEAAQTLIQTINAFIKQLPGIRSSGYQPWGSQKITDLIFVGFGSLNYKKLHPKEFQAPTWLSLWSSKDALAYPVSREEELQLNLHGVK